MQNLKDFYPELKDYYFIDETGEILFSSFSDRILSNNQLNKGYIYNDLRLENGTTKKYYRHQLVAKCFIENKDNKPYVNHIDGNKINNSVTNLEWVTPSENTVHAYKNNLINVDNKSGIKSSNRKLDEKDVRTIYFLSKYLKMNTYDLADHYDVTQQTIRVIRAKRTWIKYLEKIENQIVFND